MPGDTASLRYGRRGGGWLPAAGDPTPLPARIGRPAPRHARAVHPHDIAQARAHAASPCDGGVNVPCSCTPDPGDLDAVWAGRARMAAARRAAGRPLDETDRHALRRTDTTT